MTSKLLRLSLICFSALLTVACAGNPSREAALLLVDQLDVYEDAISEKIQAERAFYSEIRTALQETATRQAWTAQELERLNRIIALTDRAMVVDQGVQVSVLQEFLRQEYARARERAAAEAQQREEFAENYRVSFESISARQQELSATRSKLLALSQDKVVADQLFQQIQDAATLALELEREERADQPSETEGD